MVQDIWTDIQQRLDLLDVAVKELGKRGRAYAEAESEYRTALATEVLRLREEKGHPVTLVPDLARGNKEVARLKVERDCAEALYKAALEAINVNKIRIRVLESQMDREYRG